MMVGPAENPQILRGCATWWKTGTSMAKQTLVPERRGLPLMAQVLDQDAAKAKAERERALKILAKSIFRELKTNGYEAKEVVALSTELLSLITSELRPETDASK